MPVGDREEIFVAQMMSDTRFREKIHHLGRQPDEQQRSSLGAELFLVQDGSGNSASRPNFRFTLRMESPRIYSPRPPRRQRHRTTSHSAAAESLRSTNRPQRFSGASLFAAARGTRGMGIAFRSRALRLAR